MIIPMSIIFWIEMVIFTGDINVKNKKMKTQYLLALLLLFSACTSQPNVLMANKTKQGTEIVQIPNTHIKPSPPKGPVKSGKPTKAEAIKMVFENHDILLKNMKGCEGDAVGLGSNPNIADHLSNVWGIYGEEEEEKKQYVEVLIHEGENKDIKEKHWTVIFNIGLYIDANDAYNGWGVGFVVLDKNQEVLRDSFFCSGWG